MKEDLYKSEKEKSLAAALLSLKEAFSENQIWWDEALTYYNLWGQTLDLDHLMVQSPDMNDPKLKYYKLGENLKLKEGNDFNIEIGLVQDGMDYELFKSRTLHRVGNLKLKGGDKNKSKRNTSEEDFVTFKQIIERSKNICDTSADFGLQIEKPSFEFKPTAKVSSKTKISGNFDLSMEHINYSKTKPTKVTINGEEINISSNKDIIIAIAKYIFKLNPGKLIELAKTKWCPRKRIILSEDGKDLTRASELLDNKVYIETNLSSNDIIAVSRMLLKEFEISPSLVSIFIPE